MAALAGLGHRVVLRTRLVDPASHSALAVLASPVPLTGYRDLLAAAVIVVLPLHPPTMPAGSARSSRRWCRQRVVVSASPGIVEHVEHGRTAWVVPCHDPVARKAVDSLLAGPALRRRLGEAAREAIVRNSSLEAWADTIERVAHFPPPANRSPG